MTKIPLIAGWLLSRFGVPRSNESLMGDLVEERGSGRSALWFWRETLVAIVDMVARDLRDHKLLAVRAVATGWAMNWAWGQAQPVLERVAGRVHLWGWEVTTLFAIFLWPAIVGWAVARTHRAHQAALVLIYTASMAILVLYRNWGHPLGGAAAFFCFALPLTLIGGFLQRPQPRSA
jgi:hypothetical protein